MKARSVTRPKLPRPAAWPVSSQLARFRGGVARSLGTCLAILGTLGAAGVVAAQPAAAARPVKGALYGDGTTGDKFVVAYLRVSTSGRWLNPRLSAVDWDRRNEDCGERKLHLGFAKRPVRIRRGGRFSFVHRRGRFVFRVRGRFVTKNRVKLKVRYRRDPVRGGSLRRCDTSRDRLRPRRIVPLRFRNCSAHRARTLLRAPSGRAFRELRWVRDSFFGRRWAETAYACLYSVNRPVKLGEPMGFAGDSSDIRHLRLVGPYVAYVQLGDCGLSECDDVLVDDLRSGRRARRLGAGYGLDLELKSNGSVAFIGGLLREPNYVEAADSHGVRQLDSGNISATSLTLNGSTLTWRKDGGVRSATLY
jgi:hypothetical protein